MYLHRWGAVLAVCAWWNCTTGEAWAVDRFWIAGSDFWNIDNNWNPAAQPQAADNAFVDGNPEVTDVEIFSELTNTGTIDITTGTLQPTGDTTNNGTIHVGDGSAIVSSFNPGNSTRLSGSGQVILKNSDNTALSKATIVGGSNAAGAVTNAAGHTIRGEGNFSLHWINDGTVIAEETSGNSSAVLRLDNTTFTNNGELRSSSGASINLNFATYSQGASGQLIADTDNILLTGLTSLSGGTLESVGGGIFDVNGLITLAGVTVNAPIDNSNLAGDGRLYVGAGGVTNNSTITLDAQSGSVSSQFGFTSPGTLDGSGEVVLVGGNSGTFVGVFPGSSSPFTHGANHTIRGAGGIAASITNNGTIRAEVQNGNVLTINSTQTNHSLMEAASGAILRFVANVSNTSQSATGVISAADGGRVELNGQTVTGGTLRSVGSGVIAIEANSPTLADVTIDVGSNVNVIGGKTLFLSGSSITNNGAITLNSNNVNSVGALSHTSNLALNGTGEVVLNTPNNQPSRIGPFGSNLTLTNGADHTLRGEGILSGTLVNQGRIEGNSETDPILVYGRLSGTGTLKNVNFGLNVFVGNGVHAPGVGTAIVPLEGDYTISHPVARLEMELGGTTPGSQHDQLSSTGTVHLGGTLDVLLVDLGNNYVPMAGDRFEIISSTSAIFGTFSAVNFPTKGWGHTLNWQPVDYTTDPTKVFLELATVAPDILDGDYNDDGIVNLADYTLWRDNLGSPAGTLMNDPNPGAIGVSQYTTWKGNFGNTSSPPASFTAATVPEPCSVALIGLFLVLTLADLRRR